MNDGLSRNELTHQNREILMWAFWAPENLTIALWVITEISWSSNQLNKELVLGVPVSLQSDPRLVLIRTQLAALSALPGPAQDFQRSQEHADVVSSSSGES
jgi:hypothetical protein